MAEVYVGQIMMSGFGFAPRGFAACNGQLLPIQQNQALFALLGTFYGGNGSSNFALPNLQGSVPVHFGPSVDANWQPPAYPIGTRAGVEAVTLTTAQMPAHTHIATALTTEGTLKLPTNALPSGSGTQAIYANATDPQVTLTSQMLGAEGGNQSHGNMQPFKVINFNIALSGFYPTRN